MGEETRSLKLERSPLGHARDFRPSDAGASSLLNQVSGTRVRVILSIDFVAPSACALRHDAAGTEISNA